MAKSSSTKLPDVLVDSPAFLAEAFQGYAHFKDSTVQDFSMFTYPSCNFTVPDFDKAIPDLGKTLIGQTYTENSGINGNQQRFTNMGGIVMEVREWSSANNDLADVIEVGYLNNRMVFSGLTGSFALNEIISGQTSGASAKIVSIVGTVLFLGSIIGNFSVAEEIIGQTSGAHATTVLVPLFFFHPITELTNPLPRGVHEYYFDQWFDTDLNPAENKNLPRLIWVNGYADSNVPAKGAVYSWTGGIGVITSFVSNTSISTDPALTWRSLGFNENASGDVYIVINGIAHQVPTPSDLDTSTLNITSTAGIAIGDTVTSQIESDQTPVPFDSCKQNKNYMFYGYWNSRDYYMSNAYNRDSTALVTNASAVQNDLVIADGNDYTGTTPATIQLSMVSTPNANLTSIFSPGTGDTEGDNLQILGTFNNPVAQSIIIVCTGATAVNIFINGSSVASGIVMASYYDSSHTYTIPGGSGVQVYWVDDGAGSHVVNSGWDLTFGGTDLFNVFLVSSTGSSTPIATNQSAASIYTYDGVEFSFASYNGHTIGDTWTVDIEPTINRAWDNFYYSLPARLPGQGYKYRLPSNFWTHDTQEESMYVNSANGEWSVIDTILASNLLSETVTLTPLKQTGANKALYPYLTGHLDDDLVYINTEKSLDTLGRKQFLEKPQTGYLSDPVKRDFEASSFVGGRIKYVNKRLYISSPEDGITHCYDTFKKYWQAPKTFPEMGLLSIIDDNLVAHSNTRNQTFTVFTNKSGDNGQEYLVSIRTPYTSMGYRWTSKYSSNSFIEGYITGNPPLMLTIYSGIGGAGGIYPHAVEPVVTPISDTASFGEGAFGSHSFGSDVFTESPHFNEIWKRFSPVLQWYFLSMGLTCITKSHTWELLSMGMNAMESSTGNNTLIAPSNLSKNNP